LGQQQPVLLVFFGDLSDRRSLGKTLEGRFAMARPLRFIVAAAIALGAGTPLSAAELIPDQRAKLIGSVDAYAPRISDVALKIWAAPELGYQETKTTALLQEELRNAGFAIEAGVAGMPTAFVARAGTSGGPVIAILAEMDALPGLSQAADPDRKPIPDQIAGHACGHHLFGSGAVAAAVAIKSWLEATGTKGEIRVYGTPAEEGGGGKVYMVHAGLFKDVDATLYWHPADANNASQDRNLATTSAKFRFHGQSAHAAAAPDRGRSALDAVEAMNFMVNYMREHVPQEARIHYVITNGGTAPNIVPEFAESYYMVRHPDPRVVGELFERVVKAAQGAALGTGTTMDYELIGGDYSVLPNDVLGRAMDANLRRVGAPTWTPAEIAFAEKLRKNLPGRNLPALASASEIRSYGYNGQKYSSTDSGDVSWVTPLATLNTATWVPGTAAHSWQAVAAGGTSIGLKAMVVAAKTLALTGAQLLADPALVAAAKAEFDKSRGPDFVYKPLIGERDPPLNYRNNASGPDAG
jgi:aminobenzoyl-glutamate utilization protein B